MHPRYACPHGVVHGQCNHCLADQLLVETTILSELRSVAIIQEHKPDPYRLGKGIISRRPEEGTENETSTNN